LRFVLLRHIKIFPESIIDEETPEQKTQATRMLTVDRASDSYTRHGMRRRRGTVALTTNIFVNSLKVSACFPDFDWNVLNGLCPIQVRLQVAAALPAQSAVLFISGKRKTHMKNPWIKKNPFLSMWLSGANAVAGAARSRATAEAKRQAATMMTQGAKQVTDFWTGALIAPPPSKKKRKRR